jgi:hypothetical protein
LTRAAATDDLPQSVTVRLINRDGETTSVGTLDMETGELSFFDEQSGKAERASETWYTLDGVRLDGKPSSKGIYIRSTSGRLQGKNNGKKVAIK